ncbi:UvrD-helicase domain-containing protein [Paenibacillus ehimensis]|uniref:ATP-dependent helicase n=1 Tax=Paenibacillus ehimensis TaxID=79264 RepID=A0ABT8VD35_9BACL|nr:ATP-dependent helicase [Paenibacillus ehimensis]MDO3678896.1 ATP-dependent helicase [Paenibacillus ehimensis]MEC0211066.1 ATP-dependent helicase [Paenibacillus ehimensis]
MVEERLELEVKQIFECVKYKKNFLLSGGAGSGKTYSLVQVIRKAINDNPLAKVSCVTYTNAAVKEITERVNHPNLTVSTIHDFLWDSIKIYQRDLKRELINLINDEYSTIISPDGTVDMTYFDALKDGIQYKEYSLIREGIVSHDEVLVLANVMFKNYSLLCDILKDKYRYVFIDEYQDTSPLVVEIFLEHLKKSKKESIIGFFGDAMQSIYEGGIGDLKKYIESGMVVEIQKKQNRRNPELVIELANKLRTDGLIQEPSIDPNAPNMIDGKVKKGSVKFLYSENRNLEEIKSTAYFKDWDFNNSKQTKELYLTHNLIAARAGFPSLMEIYDKDPIIGLKNEVRNKIKKENILINESDSFDQIVDEVALRNKKKQLKKDLIIQDPKLNELYNRLKDKPYSEVKKIYLDKESLIDDKKQDEDDENKKGSNRDPLIKHLFKIQSTVHLYKEKNYNEFIRKTEYPLTSVKNKKEIREIISEFDNFSNKTIEDVIEYADKNLLCRKDDNYNRFIQENDYLYSRIREVRYREFQNLYDYLEGFTPFSTQHKIKGAEFQNVFVLLDNGKWNNFNFDYLFSDTREKESVYLRTKKIFYVCCTRAKENLVVFFHNPNEKIINQAISWFGEENVHKI